MSFFLDRLTFFQRKQEEFADGHGQVTDESRQWEDAYRNRWQHDKIVRSTHGVNCTGSCSWKIYVKNGLVTWETQQTDYPRTRPGLPNHEPRGCARGASYSWYIYSANRLKHPMMREHLMRLWREARSQFEDPVDAWASIVEDPAKTKQYKSRRGKGGMVRSTWDEVNELIASANIYTIKQYGPDRLAAFSPIPAMSMVSYAAGTRYMSLLGGYSLSFYDWYCDLPPSSPMTWGEQTDVPESADWYNSGFIMMWGSNVPQTRTPDAHFMTEARYKGTEIVTVSPDYSEASKFGDMWLHPKQGTDSALGMALGHVMLKEFHVDNPSDYFREYAREYTDFPHLIRLDATDEGYQAGRMLRASDFDGDLDQANNPDWKPVAWDELSDGIVVPQGGIGFRWGDEGQWNLEPKRADGADMRLKLSHIDSSDEVAEVGFPYFGGQEHELGRFTPNVQEEVIYRRVPARRVALANGESALVASVYDLITAHYGVDRGLDCPNTPKTLEENKPYTPAWQEQITGVPKEHVIKVARRFAETAHKTRGKSMVILGAGLNHWYHMDMSYRAIINMLVFCGCCGQSGGGWAHYVGQEKLRPQTGWLPVAFGLDWARPPRQMNSTSFFYSHSDQWRYEKLNVADLLSPLAKAEDYPGHLIDFNVKAERMGWLPTAPQFNRNPLQIARDAQEAGQDPKDYVVEQLKHGGLRMACEDPDTPENFPRNMFIWRSNLLGASGKGHEYFLKHLLGTAHGVQNKDLGEVGANKPNDVVWRDDEAEGKLDLLTTLDFRMSTTCLYSDVVLPTATWYEKNDLNTSDMHPFIHPLCEAVNPCWESRSDWDIYKGLARKFSELVDGHLGKETDVVSTPLMHDSPAELGQAFEVQDWGKGECEPVPGKTMPNITTVERDYPNTFARFTALGPLMSSAGNGFKGISWNTEDEVDFLGELNGKHLKKDAANYGLPKMETAIDAAETILTLAPETNGEVAVKAWRAQGNKTGIDHTHLALYHMEDKIRFHDLVAQPRKIISSPVWSGVESEDVCYTANYTNVHERIPWRTLSGRQELYQDHPWMRAFGEAFVCYKPPVNMATTQQIQDVRGNGNPEIALNWITPHQKWGIHSTYTDNLLMLTLSRGGPCVWISEIDAQKVGMEDNDWIECFNANGALVARAVVSQRVPEGMVMMYHAQEKLVNTPGSEISGERGGIHNSVTRTVLKPTHMIGGYAQQSWGFNYYGTVGSNRDEFVVVRVMNKVDWLEGDDESIYEAEEQA